MKNVMRRSVLACSMSLGLAQGLMASKIDLTTHGRLSAGFFGNSSNIAQNGGSLGLNAYVMSDFGLNEHWNVGVGASGIWNVWSMLPFNNPQYISSGDVSDIYMVYRNSGLKVVAGRYNIDVGTTIMRSSPYVNGPIQGVSVQWNPKGDTSAYRLWAHYIDSFLDNGYLPGRIGSDLARLNPYFDSGKKKIGGEVFLFGADYNKSGFLITPWILLNTKAPDGTTRIRLNPVLQIAANAKYNYKFNPNWFSITVANLALQIGDMGNTNTLSNEFLGMVTADEEIKYVRYGTNNRGKKYEVYSVSFGGGTRVIIGEAPNKFFTINDRIRFYGKFTNGANNIGQGGTWTVYLFGTMSNRMFEAQLLAGVGSYSEVSAVGLWKAYRQTRNSDEGTSLGFDVGGGYVFSNGAGAANHALMAFGRLSY